MPRGVYERTPEMLARLQENAARARAVKKNKPKKKKRKQGKNPNKGWSAERTAKFKATMLRRKRALARGEKWVPSPDAVKKRERHAARKRAERATAKAAGSTTEYRLQKRLNGGSLTRAERVKSRRPIGPDVVHVLEPNGQLHAYVLTQVWAYVRQPG